MKSLRAITRLLYDYLYQKENIKESQMSKNPNLIIICEDNKTSQLLISCLTDLFDLTIIGYNTNPTIYYDPSKLQLLVLVAHPPPTFALKKLRELMDDNNTPPVFLISEEWNYPSIVTAHRFGVVDFLELPIRPTELLSRLHDYFSTQADYAGNTEETEGSFSQLLRKLSKKIFQTKTNIIHPYFIETDKGSTTLEIGFLGQFSIALNGNPLEHLFNKKSKSLFSYLLYHYKKPIPREKLIALFWPHTSYDCGRNSLNVCIRGIRKILESASPQKKILITRNNCYELAPDIIIKSDVSKFKRTLKYAKNLELTLGLDEASKEYQKTKEYYKGEFLKDLFGEPWTESIREEIKVAYMFTLNKLINYTFSREKYTHCINYCKLLLELDAYSEDIHFHLMQCYINQGMPNLAIWQYKHHTKMLEKELGLQPAPFLSDLYQSVNKR